MKREPLRRPMAFGVILLCVVSVAGLQLRADEKASCGVLLTTAEVQAALGTEIEGGKPAEYSPGFTLCSWMKDRPEGGLGVHLSLFELQAMREGEITAESIPEYFDLQVKAKKEEGGAEPEILDGIGKRAVLFSEEHLWIVMIELEKGFVHLGLSPGDITRDQVVAMAKAVDSRAKE